MARSTQEDRAGTLAHRIADDAPPLRALLEGFSIEVTARDAEKLGQAGHRIPPGTVVSIPHLPSEGHTARIRTAKAIREAGFAPVPHVAARRFNSHRELEGYLDELAQGAGVEQLLVIAGDCEPQGPFTDSATLLASGLLAKYRVRHVVFGGHPDGHPQVAADVMNDAMLRKAALAESQGIEWSVMTQFSFSAEPVVDWIARIRRLGVNRPVSVGVAGPASIKTLLRFAAICGVGASASVLKKYGFSITQLFSTAGPDLILGEYARLLRPDVHGQVRIHFYPFGGIEKMCDWLADSASAR